MIACSATRKIKIAAKKDLLQNEALTSAHLGISIYEPANGKFWYNHQGNKYFVPASNTKLFTCYAALKYLGDSIVGIKYKETEDTLFIMPVGDPTFLDAEFTNQPVFDFLKKSNKPIALRYKGSMAICAICNKGLNSTYVRIGSLGSFQKIGYSCLACDIHYDKKLYTDSQRMETYKTSPNWPSFSKQRMLRPGFDPGFKSRPEHPLFGKRSPV